MRKSCLGSGLEVVKVWNRAEMQFAVKAEVVLIVMMV